MSEVLRAVFLYHHKILQPHASYIGIVKAGFNGYYMIDLQGLTNLA